MKRSSESADPESGREKAYRRQEPVSCTFCRSKKLKCSREAPCSNCSARKLTCSLVGSVSIATSPFSRTTDTSQPTSNPSLEDLQTRLRKLEELLAAKLSPDVNPSSSATQSIPFSAEPAGNSRETEPTSKNVPWLQADALEHEPFFPDNNDTSDVKVAESFGSFIFNLTRPQAPPSLKQNIATLLPSRKQAEPLLEFFFLYINWIYHIVHVPTTRGQFSKLYTQLENNESPDLGPLSLIATILSLSAYFATPTSGFYFQHVEAVSLSRRWTMVAQDAMSASNCLTNPTIETLQSLILISQLRMPNIGAIATLRSIAATTIYAARALDLHLVDSPSNRKTRENSSYVDWVGIEVKRRLWWHLVSTDWFLSFMSGPQCGTYMIQPQHMSTEWPSNTDDAAISPYGSYAKPIDEATEMTYTIFRIKGSIIFKEISDASWEHSCDIDSLPYNLVLEFDTKLNNLILEYDKIHANLGKVNYSALSPSSREQDRKSYFLAVQRIIGQFGVHTRFARLHRPYLIKGIQDPRYSYSRMVCLRSSRKVIECGKEIMNLNQDFACIKLWMLNHHIFVSTVILVMDYCFNREEPRAKERKEEILDCFRILEALNGESTIASRGILKLQKLLREGGKGSQSGGDSSPLRSQEHEKKAQVPFQIPAAAPIIQHGVDSMQNGRFNEVQGPPTYQFADMDFSSFEDINFDDIELDASQFEALFNYQPELI